MYISSDYIPDVIIIRPAENCMRLVMLSFCSADEALDNRVHTIRERFREILECAMKPVNAEVMLICVFCNISKMLTVYCIVGALNNLCTPS